jgi:hypothetical protein
MEDYNQGFSTPSARSSGNVIESGENNKPVSNKP